MTTQNEDGTKTEEAKNEGNPQSTSQTGASTGPTLEEVIADRDKWKNLSRQNESNYNTTRTELQKLQEAQNAAVEAAKTEGRTSALGEVSKDLVTKELQLQAALTGAELPGLDFLDLDRFKGDDARPSAEAVKTFIESLPKGKNSGSGFPHLEGAGHNRGGTSDFTSTDPNELADFISGGSFL
ncbi:hypothetical protein [Streptomyces sp. NPDC057363]|uniref:hypothetical protein n=1 Tax=Streptomyces sp. NPDC057363 TaxID=3346107 RepID=UPI00363B0A67